MTSKKRSYASDFELVEFGLKSQFTCNDGCSACFACDCSACTCNACALCECMTCSACSSCDTDPCDTTEAVRVGVVTGTRTGTRDGIINDATSFTHGVADAASGALAFEFSLG